MKMKRKWQIEAGEDENEYLPTDSDQNEKNR